MKLRTIHKINPYCHREVWFAVPTDFNPIGKSIEEIYAASLIADFNKEVVSHYAIKHNLNQMEGK